MSNILSQKFFNRDTPEVAENLLGKYLVKSGEKSKIITEVEAYNGPYDKACHAYKGKTKRTEVMFGPPGHWYIYLIYGMYWMLNIVTGPEKYPAAVLIRGVEGINGPGKLTRDLGINNKFNGEPANKETGLWMEDRKVRIDKKDIVKTPRIGVGYAKEWKDKLYRFVLINELR